MFDPTPRFRDRGEAGRRLAARLQGYAGRADVVVLGLPRGGVPVALEVARRLKAPMDIFLVRKLGVPGQEELAMGAIASGGVRVIVEEVVTGLGIAEDMIESVARREAAELERRERVFRGGRPPLALEGRQAILIDDGLATGASMLAAVRGLKARRPARIVVAVPVAPPDTCAELRRRVNEVICLITPHPFGGVGAWYESFPQVGDGEVRACLREAEAIAIWPRGGDASA